MHVEKEHVPGADVNAPQPAGDVLVHSLEKIKTNLPLRKNPVKVVLRCVVKMKTNQQKRVEAFRMSIYTVENDYSIEV